MSLSSVLSHLLPGVCTVCACVSTTVKDVDMALLTHLKKSMVESNFYG